MIYFLSFLLVPLAVSLMVPRVWLLPCALLVALVFAGAGIDEQRLQCASCGGPFSGLGFALLAIATAGFALGVALRALIAFFRPAGQAAPGQARVANLLTWLLLSVTLALLATGLGVVLLNRVFDSGGVTHLGMGLLALAWFFGTPLAWRKKDADAEQQPKPSLWRPARVFRWAGTATVLILLGWSVRTIPAVMDAAEVAAAGRPYCILTPSSRGARPARTWWDLSGFSMQADRGALRHAALVTGALRSPEWFYWSYRQRGFEPDAMGGAVTCEPRAGFASKLPARQPAETGDTDARFWLARGQWRIPAAYLGGGTDHPPVLVFHAQGKAFEPLPASARKPDADIVELINAEVRVTLCDRERLHVWQAQDDINHKVDPAGVEAGLEKQWVQSRGSPRSEFQYLGRNADGRVSTWLLCHQGGGTCRHAFRREGFVVEFQQPLSQFARWQEMQDAAWTRVRSFAVLWPDAPASSCKS